MICFGKRPNRKKNKISVLSRKTNSWESCAVFLFLPKKPFFQHIGHIYIENPYMHEFYLYAKCLLRGLKRLFCTITEPISFMYSAIAFNLRTEEQAYKRFSFHREFLAEFNFNRSSSFFLLFRFSETLRIKPLIFPGFRSQCRRMNLIFLATFLRDLSICL